MANKTRKSTRKPYLCNTCGTRFALKIALASHARTHFNENIKTNEVKSKKRLPQPTVMERTKPIPYYKGKKRPRIEIEKPYVCPVCNKRFSQKFMVHIHSRVHSGEKLVSCVIQYKPAPKEYAEKNTSKLVQSVWSGNENNVHKGTSPIKTPPTNKKISSKRNINNSKPRKPRKQRSDQIVKVRNGKIIQKPYYCKACNSRFAEEETLNKHNCLTKSEKIHQFIPAGSLAESSTAVYHMQFPGQNIEVPQQQDDENKFQCDVCYERFMNKFLLDSHYLTHATEKPYACDVCHKSFATNSSLMSHSVVHSTDKPFACHICNKRFLRKTALNSHYSVHSIIKPYSCQLCPKTFCTKTSLDHHYRVHSGAKPYSCDVCFKTFSEKTYLVRHMRTHVFDKPYVCKLCDKKFSKKKYLLKHKAEVHDEEEPPPTEKPKIVAERVSAIENMDTSNNNKPQNPPPAPEPDKACKIVQFQIANAQSMPILHQVDNSKQFPVTSISELIIPGQSLLNTQHHVNNTNKHFSACKVIADRFQQQGQQAPMNTHHSMGKHFPADNSCKIVTQRFAEQQAAAAYQQHVSYGKHFAVDNACKVGHERFFEQANMTAPHHINTNINYTLL